MKYIIGSARIDENGHATGGKAGDQKQNAVPDMKGEVAQQTFYDVGKWGYVLRSKTIQAAISIALSMIQACNNPNVGYNQAKRLEIIKYGTGSNVPINCDCSTLVRQCVREAGIEVGNFTTANEANVLLGTGAFDKLTYANGMKLCTGDILVTKTKGHTVVVTDGESRTTANSVALPTVTKGSKGDNARLLQHNLNQCGYSLAEDGDFGKLSTAALKDWQAKNGLVSDGIYGKKSEAKMRQILS